MHFFNCLQNALSRNWLFINEKNYVLINIFIQKKYCSSLFHIVSMDQATCNFIITPNMCRYSILMRKFSDCIDPFISHSSHVAYMKNILIKLIEKCQDKDNVLLYKVSKYVICNTRNPGVSFNE